MARSRHDRDMDDNEDMPDRLAQIGLYLETLRARMTPEQFGVLTRLLAGPVQVAASEADHVDIEIPDEDEHLLAEVRDEFLASLAVVFGGLDNDGVVVDLGDGITALVPKDAADDPAAHAEIRVWIAEQRQRDRDIDTTLRGIEQASRDEDSLPGT